MSLRDLIGKFIVLDEMKPSQPTGGEPPGTMPASSTSPLPPATSSAIDLDFSDIYRQAGILPAPFTAEEALKALSALPKELFLDANRDALKAMLQAMSRARGTPPESVVDDAKRKVEALTATVEEFKGQVADFAAKAEREIATFQEQIEEKRKAIDQAQGQEQKLTEECQSEAKRLTDLLQFFGSEPRTSPPSPSER
jgi:hypothetical protein